MAQGRMLVRRISKNDEIADLVKHVNETMGPQHGAYAALLYTWCIPHLDVEGRMHGDPRLVRAEVFPLLEWISAGDVTEYLRHLAAAGLVVWYKVGNRQFLFFPGFDGSQPGLRKDREQPSIIPPPSDDAGVTPESCRSDAGKTRAEVEEKLIEIEVEEKGARGVSPQLPLGPDLGKADSAAQRKMVDRQIDAFPILEALNAARARAIPGSRPIRPTYSSLAGIAGRLEAGKTFDECMQVIANCEAECKTNPKSREYFDAVSPWRPENFERRLSANPSAAAQPNQATTFHGKVVGVAPVGRPTKSHTGMKL